MRMSPMLALSLFTGLLMLSASALGEEEPKTDGPWTVIDTSQGVFRINRETGTSDVFRDGEKPRWERIAEPEAGAELSRVAVVRLGATVEGPVTLKRLDSGKTVEFKAVRICDVRPHGPFADAGISTTDMITQLAGKDVATSAEIEAALYALNPGESLVLTLYRIDARETPGTCEAPRRKFEEVTVTPAGK